MARPNRTVNVHRYFFEGQARKVKDAIGMIVKKDSLNDGDIQAVKQLTEVYESLITLSKGNDAHGQADCNIACHPEPQEK